MNEFVLYQMELKITLRTPFLTKSSAPGKLGLDAVLARNAEGVLYLPGTLVAGRLREAWEQLDMLAGGAVGFAAQAEDWLGPRQSSDFAPNRKRLVIFDLELDGRLDQREPLQRIRIDPSRGATAKGALQVIEQAEQAGSTVCFAGTAQVHARPDEIARIVDSLRAGLGWLTNLGAARTIGFGRVHTATVSEPRIVSAAPFNAPQVRMGLRLTFSQPFCVSKRRLADNLFESAPIIAGGVIKGALAQTWATRIGKRGQPVALGLDLDRPALSKHFDRVRFTHAFPSAYDGVRPVQWPDSLVQVDEEVWDIALCDGPRPINGRAPEFQIDWKSRLEGLAKRLAKQYGWPEIKHELRIRTAIDWARRTRRAEEGRLFAYEMIVPGETFWLCDVDLSGIPDASEQASAARELTSLLADGISYVGKTKARAEVAIGDPHTLAIADRTRAESGLWIVTLQTPALLADPMELDETSGADELRREYGNAWRQMSDKAFELHQYFARQTLAGGEYQRHRFGGARPYSPYFLTEAGSVFVLKATGQKDPEKLIEEWVRKGLPLPIWVAERYQSSAGALDGAQWNNCPYVRENGFGEIVVNLPCHIEPGRSRPQ